jgi:hypothetical protein
MLNGFMPCSKNWDARASTTRSRQEGVGERLGVGERHHVAGALDQRMLRLRHVPPEDVADRVVNGGRLRSLDDVDRRGHPGEHVKCEQVVEENVP